MSYAFENLKLDTEMFLKSEYGKFVMETLQEKLKGSVSRSLDIKEEHRLSYLDKSAALEEVIEFIRSGLDIDIPSRESK